MDAKKLTLEDVATSRSLFSLDSSTSTRQLIPTPVDLEVIAVVGGIPFSADLTNHLLNYQNQVKLILGDILSYYVKPENLGLELCVLKWPEDPYSLGKVVSLQKYLEEKSKISRFKLTLAGFQVHKDGCIIALGFDEKNIFTSLRKKILDDLPFLPRKQSTWCHIPLGRILEPIPEGKIELIKKAVNNSLIVESFQDNISTLKLVHEHQWYMERRKTLAHINLSV